MKVLLINPQTLLNFSKYLGTPLGIAQLASSIRDLHQVKIIDLNVEPMPTRRLIKKVKEFNPDIIGISCVSLIFPQMVELSRAIKEAHPVPVVFGGNHITARPEQSLGFPGVDFVISGEGEHSFKRFLDEYEADRDDYDVPGLGYKTRDGEVRVNPPGPLIDPLDDLPPPAWDLLPMKKYRTRFRQHCTSMLTRGCPYSCTYCAAHLTHGKKVRKRSIDHVMEDLNNLYHNYGVRFLALWDDILTFDRDYMIDFCERKLKEGLDMEFWGNTRVDRVDPELLKLMKKAGCRILTYGIETGNSSVLELVKKGVTLDQTRKALSWTREAEIVSHGFLMINFLGETEREMQRTIDFAMDLGLFLLTIQATVPLPGTEYEKLYSEKIHEPDLLAHDFADNRVEDIFYNGVVPTQRVRELLATARRRMIMRPLFLRNFVSYYLKGAKPTAADLAYYASTIPILLREIASSRPT
jgi:radical SAM superfamily enzyme YgiQ (UPF0313 family)